MYLSAHPQSMHNQTKLTADDDHSSEWSKWHVQVISPMSKIITLQKLKYEKIALPSAQKTLLSVLALSTSLAKKKSGSDSDFSWKYLMIEINSWPMLYLRCRIKSITYCGLTSSQPSTWFIALITREIFEGRIPTSIKLVIMLLLIFDRCVCGE